MPKKQQLISIKVDSFVTEAYSSERRRMDGNTRMVPPTQFPMCVNTTFTQVTYVLCKN